MAETPDISANAVADRLAMRPPPPAFLQTFRCNCPGAQCAVVARDGKCQIALLADIARDVQTKFAEAAQLIHTANKEKANVLRMGDQALNAVDVMKAELARVKWVNQDASDTCESLKAELARVKDERDGLKAELAKVKDERDGLNEERDSLKEESDGLHAMYDKLQKKAFQLHKRLKEQQVPVADLPVDVPAEMFAPHVHDIDAPWPCYRCDCGQSVCNQKVMVFQSIAIVRARIGLSPYDMEHMPMNCVNCLCGKVPCKKVASSSRGVWNDFA